LKWEELPITEFVDVIFLVSITTFQKMELILIPAIFLFSQVLILLFGLSIIGEETWIIMGMPMMLGGGFSVIFLILIQKYVQIEEFHQLEVFFRVITILGGIAIILVLVIQVFLQETGYIIFSLQTLIISVIGDIMTILCFSFLKKTFPTQGLSE